MSGIRACLPEGSTWLAAGRTYRTLLPELSSFARLAATSPAPAALASFGGTEYAAVCSPFKGGSATLALTRRWTAAVILDPHEGGAPSTTPAGEMLAFLSALPLLPPKCVQARLMVNLGSARPGTKVCPCWIRITGRYALRCQECR